jgi:hypothetical protein
LDVDFTPRRKKSFQLSEEKRNGMAKPTITVTKIVRETRQLRIFFILPLSSLAVHLRTYVPQYHLNSLASLTLKANEQYLDKITWGIANF